MSINFKTTFLAKSDRVKGIDVHPTKPWILTTHHTGQIHIWSLDTQQILKTFQESGPPVRAGKFIPEKNWIATGNDEGLVRVYDIETTEKVAEFKAHTDFVRAVVVHPSKSLIFTASDDKSIKSWDWEREWKNVQVFEGHEKYVMAVAFNPNDSDEFVSASLDGKIRGWTLAPSKSSSTSTLQAHDKGVNSIGHFPSEGQNRVITTSDDRTIKVWNITTNELVATLEGHSSNLSFAVHHPRLPIIISGAEDGSVRSWDSATYAQLESVDHKLGRAWCLSFHGEGACIGFVVSVPPNGCLLYGSLDDGFAVLQVEKKD